MSKIILSGYTPTPLDRFKRERKDFIKVSLGAEHSVPWEYRATLTPTIKKLKKEGYEIVAIEQHKNSVNLFDYQPKNKNIAILMGNEVRGVSGATLKQCDVVLEIPMQGKKESLNVSVAAGIGLFVIRQTLE